MIAARLREEPFEFEGKTYLLRCNFNVLGDVQEQLGSLVEALNSGKVYTTVKTALAAMLNDYADEQGWSERYTPAALGRKLPMKAAEFAPIQTLVLDVLLSGIQAAAEDDEKN